MSRIALTDDSSRWFNDSSASYFQEKTYFNGNNFISKATNSQYHHEALYITAGGVFILRSFNVFSSSRPTYVIFSKEEAAAWFARQEFSDDEIPSLFAKDVSDLEII